MGKKQRKAPCGQCRMIASLHLDPSDGNSYCRDCWIQCYGKPPPTAGAGDPFAEQPKKYAPPPPADFFSGSGKSQKAAATVDPWKATRKEDSSEVGNTDTVTEMVAQINSQLAAGASSSALIELLDGKNSIGGFDGTSLFTILMSPSKKTREPIYEAMPTLLAGMAGKSDGGDQGDVTTWLCENLVERTMICSKDAKRKAAVESVGRIMRHLGHDQTKQCVKSIIEQVKAALAASGKEATSGKLGALAVLQILCVESSNGAISAVPAAKGGGKPNILNSLASSLGYSAPGTALRDTLEAELYPVGGGSKEMPLLSQIIGTLGKGSKDVQAVATAAVTAAVSFILPLDSIHKVIPQLQQLMLDKKWQCKWGAVQVFEGLANDGKSGWETREAGAGSRLPNLEDILRVSIPPVIELMRDSKQEVSSAAEVS